jgi:Ubiquitin fusion degradation protein UFD1
MMRNMLLEEASLITVESVSLPVATFSKFQPQSADFLDISNPKAVLENALRHFACLTTGDIISIIYNSKVYELQVLETKPGSAVSIIECDMNVNFVSFVFWMLKYAFDLRLILMLLSATKSPEWNLKRRRVRSRWTSFQSQLDSRHLPALARGDSFLILSVILN